jgi:two-component system chemotaxis response regulator CheB
MPTNSKTRVLIIDDSAYNRRVLSDFISREPDMIVVGKACDGDEGLQLTMTEKPDVITLDLEMPRMDGFTFLRILMAKKSTPVIVISSHTQKENVFRALELGALDFVAKPTHRISPEIKEIGDEVIQKIRIAKGLKHDTLIPRAPHVSEDIAISSAVSTPSRPDVDSREYKKESSRPVKVNKSPADKPNATHIVAIAASTGGPSALTRVLSSLPANIDAGIVIVQHMPPRFTKTFAKRLNKQCQITVVEVEQEEVVKSGTAYVAPGEWCIELNLKHKGLTISTVKPDGSERYVPSADRLFTSVAIATGKNALGVILTGMGDDGSRGAKQLAEAGAKIIVEDESTAIIPGMPQAALAMGVVDHVLPLEEVAAMITNLTGIQY